jgi:phosphate transport system protein
MTRAAFDRELERLQDHVLALGNLVEKAIVGAVDTLKRRDCEAARKLMAADKHINELRYAIESDALVLIATQQPMAGDLRMVAAVLEIAGELERMGDYAKGIAKITVRMGTEPFVKPLVDIPRMAEKACDMLHRALEAFVRRDVQVARAIPAEDDEVDGLLDQVHKDLMTYIIADPRVMQRATYLMWVAHRLERTADRVVNICERVIFTVTGELVELDVKEESCPVSPE